MLKITPTDSISKEKLKTLSYKTIFNDKNEIATEIDSMLFQLERKGIFTSQFLLKHQSENTYHYNFTIGKIFNEITLYSSENDEKLLFQSLSLNETTNTITIPIEKTEIVLRAITEYYENIGFPFVEVSLLHHKIKDDKLSAEIIINKNNLRNIDKIILEGYTTFPRSFIQHQTPLKTGSVFNKAKLIKTAENLQKLPFVTQTKTPEVLFTNDSTIVYLYLTKKNAHQFDGLIGFNNSENNSKLKLHGYADLQLYNLLNKGEQLILHWQNTGQKQIAFELSTTFPYILKSPVSFTGEFNLYKQDSTYITTAFHFGLLYTLNRHSFKTEVQSLTSDRLTSAANALISDFKKRFYGLTYTYKLEKEHRFFPSELEGKLAIYSGIKTSEAQKSTQQKVEFNIHYNWELNPRNYLFFQNQSKKLIGNNFTANELFLIGGSNSIRGFNEQQIISSSFSIFTLEYRFVTSTDSYFYTLTDYGNTQNKVQNKKTAMLGLGLGYVFKINSGFLNLSYSIGKFSGTLFDFNQSKIHLKLVQIF